MSSLFNWYLLIPTFCITGIITNIFNALVFLNPRMKDPSFKYMLAISISEIVYLSSNSFLFVTYCENDCPINSFYSTQIYSLFIHEYVSRSMAIYNILVDIFLSIQRFMILKNKPHLDAKSHNWLLIILLLIAFLYYLPITFFKTINPIYNNSSNITKLNQEYKLELNDIGSSLVGKITLIFL